MARKGRQQWAVWWRDEAGNWMEAQRSISVKSGVLQAPAVHVDTSKELAFINIPSKIDSSRVF